MKKLIKYIPVVILAILLTACDKDKPDYSYDGPWYISFASPVVETAESNTEIINLDVQLVAPLQSSAISVDFTVSGENLQEGVDYELVNETQSLTFEPGVFKQSVQIKAIDNEESSGDQILNVQLTSNTAGFEMGKPGPDQLNRICQMIIGDDDCPFTLETFSGNVTGYETTPWWDDDPCPFTFTPVEELEPGVIEYKIKGFWYPQIEGNEGSSYYGNVANVQYLDVGAIINYKNPSSPTITLMEDDLAVVTWADDGTTSTYSMKPVENQSINMSVCSRTLEFSYTVLGTSWAHNNVFYLKFNFNE